MKSNRTIGLDLGGASFKLVVVEPSGNRHALVHSKVVDLPLQADSAARQAALAQLLSGIPIEKNALVVSVMDDPFACTREVITPPMPSGELSGAIQWELQRYLAVPAEETLVDYELLEEVEVQGAKKLKLLAAAIPAQAIRDHLELLSGSGIRPVQLVPKALALARWFQETQKSPEGAVAVLDLGGTGSEFVVVKKGRLLFARKIPVAGCDLTKGMTGVLMTAQGQVGLTEQEAEEIKRKVGIPPAGFAEPLSRGISATQLLSLIRGSLERLAQELERSLAFYAESTREESITELLLVGGGANLKGLPQWLEGRLGIRVAVPENTELALASPSGAAWMGGRGINLLPGEIRQALRIQVQRATMVGVLTALVAGMIFLKVGMGITRQTLATQIHSAQIEMALLTPQVSRAKVELTIRDRRARQPDWVELFRNLSRTVPREIYLTSLGVQDAQIVLRGRLRDLGKAPDVVLSEFMEELEKGPLSQVRLNSTRRLGETSKESEFEIGCFL
ncbi:MAG: pilus assembly protein PilM [Candidatus Omnitrophica bacterium]|nr:pilus assembly protein PilM [Candidatus Omnitrophota bacterium]